MIEAEQKLMENLHAGYVRKIERELQEMKDAVALFESEYQRGFFRRHELYSYWAAKRKFDERMHWFRVWAPAPTASIGVNEYYHKWYATLYNELIKCGVVREYY